MKRLNWDDLHFFLAAVQAGTYTGAAHDLGVDRTTIGRRVSALESNLGMPLFEQTQSGYHPTEAGRAVLEAARGMELELEKLRDRLAVASRGVEGLLRLSIPDGFEELLLSEVIAFANQYPGIRLDLLNTRNTVTTLTERKADIGFCILDREPDHMHGIRITELPRAVYASKGYLASNKSELSQHKWIGWHEEISDSRLSEWMQTNLLVETEMVMEANNLGALKESVLGGLGVAFLWCFIGDRERRLKKIYTAESTLNMSLWLLWLEDLPPNSRMKAFMEFFEDNRKKS